MNSYTQYIQKKEREHESLCKRCGICCGILNDPCIHLKKDSSKQFFCEIYFKRIGHHSSKEGNTFRCVPIRNILHENWKDRRRDNEKFSKRALVQNTPQT